MRSRYSAYVRLRADYLRATWHPSTAPVELELAPGNWLGLELRAAQVDGDTGLVEFVPGGAKAVVRSACTSAAASCAKARAGTTSTVR